MSHSSASAGAASGNSDRLLFLDALRGFDMFWIVGGAGIVRGLEKMTPSALTTGLTEQLTHVEWEGFRFYDLIFPLFLFIVGVSMVFSLQRSLSAHGPKATLLRVLRRSVLLFALGVFATGGLSKPWPEVALGGVLHRIAACYAIAALLFVLLRRAKPLLLAAALLLLGYWALLRWVPVPDFKLEKSVVEALAAKVGSTDPARISASVSARVVGNLEEGRNLTNHFDFRFLPGKKAQGYYINEGLLSTFPAVALCLFGAVTAIGLRRQEVAPCVKLMSMMAASVAALVLGLLWSLEFPMIKRIWTSSFVLAATGFSLSLMALFYAIIEMRGWRRWCHPFVWIGCNPITLYLVSPLVGFSTVAQRLVGGDISNFLDARVAPGAGAMLVAFTGVGLLLALARFLFVRRIFLRV